jgi:hypothetical protein
MSEDTHVPDGDFTTDPMDVSGFSRATVVCRVDAIQAGPGRSLALNFKESDDQVDWTQNPATEAVPLPGGSSELVRSVELDTHWLRLNFALSPAGPGHVHFRTEIRFHKRKP